MDRFWLNSYPEGVPQEVDPDRYRSLTELLEASFRKHADQPFSVCMDRRMPYRELDELSAALGAWLQVRGLEPGVRVAIMLPKLPQFAVSMAAVLRAGYTCVNVNPLYTARELEHQLRDSGATAIVLLENFAHMLEQVMAQTPVRHAVRASLGDLLGPWRGRWLSFAARHFAKMVPALRLPMDEGGSVTPFKAALAQGRSPSLRTSGQSLESVAFLQYTGGTTGLSKGAVLTHRNIVAAVLQAEAWFAPALEQGGDPRKINSIAALPPYHIFALTLCLLAIRQGSHLTLIPNPRDTGSLVEVLKKRPFHMLPAVNTLFNALLQHPQFGSVDFSSLYVSQAGGMAESEGTARQWRQVTGCTMVEGWGMSETCAIGTNNLVTQARFSGTIGLPLPGITIKDDAGQSQPPGSAGEVCIRGPNVMQGYYRQPEETRQAFTADGFLRTGDIGVMECAAVGVADDQQGEAIKVYVVRNDPLLTEEALASFCHKRLTGYKRPRYIEFRDALPKSNVGKILRRELRAVAR